MGLNARAARTRQEIRVRRLMCAKGRPRRIPKQVRPSAIERDYARQLVRIARVTRILVQPLLDELPALVAEARAATLYQDGLRADAWGARLKALVANIRAGAARAADLSTRQIELLAGRFARRIKGHQATQMAKQLKAATGIEAVDLFSDNAKLAGITEGFVIENVALVKDLPAKTLTEIEHITTRGVTSGTLHRDIAKEIQEKLKLSEKRAKLIARDQVGKFYGNVNATRHQEIGVDEFIWNTVQDERVRSQHRAIDGQRFKYSEGGAPGEGVPGQPINCRCFAEPVFDALFD